MTKKIKNLNDCNFYMLVGKAGIRACGCPEHQYNEKKDKEMKKQCGGVRLIFECILILLNIILLAFIYYSEKKKQQQK